MKTLFYHYHSYNLGYNILNQYQLEHNVFMQSIDEKWTFSHVFLMRIFYEHLKKKCIID